MSISIHSIEENNGFLTFQIRNCNMSVANSLRRTILANIPQISIISTPYEKSNVIIHKNNSRLNNEILKHRLSCIPIHIQDLTLPIDKYTVIIDETNNSDVIKKITTKHFKIKNNETGKFLSDAETKRIFPPNSFTNEYILFTRLLPKVSEQIEAETIHIEAKMSIATAEQDSTFNVVSTCSYSFAIDEVKQRELWKLKEKELKEKDMNKDEMKEFKRNWMLLDGKRAIHNDVFNFVIESVGVYENKKIIVMGCSILIEKLNSIIQKCNERTLKIETPIQMNKAFDIILENEGYTIGKVLEYMLYEKYYTKQNILQFVGFKKAHPHDDDSFLRISFKEYEKDKNDIYGLVYDSCSDLIELYSTIMKSF